MVGRSTRVAVLVGLSVAAGVVASLALADVVDPTMPHTVVVGAPRGFAPGERVDGRRRGRAFGALPFPPAETWQRRMTSGIEAAPLVGQGGEVYVVLTTPEVVALDAGGSELWRVRLGAAPAAVAPVLTSDGGLVVMTVPGVAYGVSRTGSVRFETPIDRDVECAPVALDEGGVAIAAGRTLAQLDADGVVRARATLDERAVGGLVAAPDGVLATTESGLVWSWRPPAAPRKVGALGGTPKRGAALADARTLVSVIDGRTLVALDLPTATTHMRASAAALGALLDAPPAAGAGGLAIVSTSSGLLIGVDSSGSERIHATIDKQPPTAAPDAGIAAAFFAAADAKPSPPIVVDDRGRVAFARASGRVGVVAPDGSVATVSDHLCSAPVALQPAGDKRLLVACRDGTLWMIGEGRDH